MYRQLDMRISEIEVQNFALEKPQHSFIIP
jgi:hypothetical protein